MKNICLIPARGGSKRLPRKNIKMFCGKPLITWSIEIAIKSKLFEKIYVSTDDMVIANIAKKNGAEIPFIRPKELADDFTNDKQVRDHFLSWTKSKQLTFDYLCYLYPTAPFITEETLKGCLDLLIKSNASQSLTITNFDYPVQRALKNNEEGFLDFKWEKYKNSRSQDLEELFHDAGQCYFFNLKKNENGEKVGYRLPRYLCQDIDTEEDFIMAEKLFKIKQ
tara:strand:+ start:571 stop:1239 length:669 start_codon:yes stop_codon:yes gene_type:complete